MAIPKRIPLPHNDVFPYGAFLVSEVTPVNDFERSTKDTKVQQLDKDNGLPVWAVDVVDADPEAPRKSKTVTVKIAAKHQPVPPSNDSASPFTPVEFDGLTALPYIEESGNFSRIAWSVRAAGMHAPGKSVPRPAGDQVKGAA